MIFERKTKKDCIYIVKLNGTLDCRKLDCSGSRIFKLAKLLKIIKNGYPKFHKRTPRTLLKICSEDSW